MSSNFANHVYDRVIDYIENQADSSDVRHEYARYMSQGNWNSNEMGNLVDVVVVVADAEMDNARNDREEQNILRGCITSIVDAHCGYVTMSNRRMVDRVDDRTYRNLEKAAGDWEDLLNSLRGGRGRGHGGRQQQQSGRDIPFRDRNDGGRRSVFDDSPSTGGRRTVFDKDTSDQPARSGSTVFSGGTAQRREEPAREERYVDQAFNRSARREERAPEPIKEEVKQDGPDMSLERPFDNFFCNGEQWQLAHTSTFKWSWSPKQQTRRAYDPESEVRFLVKGVDGTIREEFVAMTEDLTEEAHRIRNDNRPNRRRLVHDSESNDVIMIGDDPDAVDLDAMQNTYECVRREFLGDIEINNPDINENALNLSSAAEGIVEVAGQAAKVDNDVVSINVFQSTMLATDPNTINAIENFYAICSSENDLLAVQRALQSMRGTVSENVMNFLDKHYTNEVNSSLRDQFGFSTMSIDTFIGDFEDLLNCKKFEKLGASYRAQFLTRTRPLMNTLHFMTDAEDRANNIDCSAVLVQGDNDPAAFNAFRENILIAFKPMAFVHVKADLELFGLVDGETRVPARTGEGANPVMADLLRNLYAIGRKTSGSGRVYMVTADNICVELVAASGARDIIGLRLADI